MGDEKIILGVETSCDDTSASLVSRKNGQFTVLSNIISNQIQQHIPFGGVVPEIASRAHIENIHPVVSAAFEQANKVKTGITLNNIDAIAVTHTPGLVGSLLVGVNYAKTLAYASNLPLIPVNHIQAHICANFIEHQLPSRFLSLVVSGGHSSIILVENASRIKFTTLAKTVDDAAGEAFDKVAKVLGLPYPGGPENEKLAKNGGINAIKFPQVKMMNTYDFSFSGVKTSVINHIHNAKTPINKADIAASFQHAVCNVLVERTLELAKIHNISAIALCGGVACNNYLRKLFQETAKEGTQIVFPKPVFCTDNAAMVAVRAFFAYDNSEFGELSLNAIPTGKTS